MIDDGAIPSLKDQIEGIVQEYLSYGKTGETYFASIQRLVELLIREHALERTLKAGADAPDFTLPDADGQNVSLTELRDKGAVVVTFFRGGWCPFCDLTLRTYDQVMPRISQLSASMIAISPQPTQRSRSMSSLNFPLLSDHNNAVARQFGLVYTVPEFARCYVENLPEYNQNNTWELPMAGTFVVNKSGIITLSYVNPDFVRRLEPYEILAELKRLAAM